MYTVKFDQIKQEISQVILSHSNWQSKLSYMAQKIGELFQVQSCGIVAGSLNALNKQQIAWWHETEFPADQEDRLLQQLNKLLTEADAVSESEQIDQNLVDFFGLNENLFQEILPTKTLLGTATRYQGKTNGAIVLLKSEPTQWTQSEQELLEKISDSMAIAISQIQLQQQTQTKIRYQTLLNCLSREISQNSDLDSLFDTCLAEIGTALQVDRSLILLLKYKDPLIGKRSSQKAVEVVKGKIKLAGCWDVEQHLIHHSTKPSFKLQDSSVCQQAWQIAPEPLAIAEATSFPDVPPDRLSSEIDASGSALLMMPLMGKKMSESQPPLVLGFLVLQQNCSRLWLQDELDLINWISVQISIAIMHRQTLSQVQSMVEERTAKLKWSLDVHAKLSEKMRQQIEQLQRLNELKDDFLSSMSHELKTPLTSMKMAIKMLRQPEIPPEMRDKYLNILEQEWHREYNLIKDLLTLQQVESGEFAFSPQELNLEQIVEELTQDFHAKWQSDKGLNLKTTIAAEALHLYTDSESIEHILNELLLNAGKYSDADTTVELSANSKTTVKGKEIAIAISNYGAGVSAQEIPYIFDKFRRGKGVTDRAVPGTGLGLALVKHLVDHLNGTIEVTSELKSENESEVFTTTFTVKIPQFKPS